MKVSREQAAQNRERILDEAARQFRTHGFDGIGLVDLMKNIGLTHGGFYGHFSSKDDLIAQACARADANTVTQWRQRAEGTTQEPLAAIMSSYLSLDHRDHPGDGCLMAALGPEISRQSPAVRRAVTEGLATIIETLGKFFPGMAKSAKRKKALATFAGMVGAQVLARAVDDPDLAKEILQAVSASIATAKAA